MSGRELHWNVSGQDVSVRIEQTTDHGTFHIDGRSIHFRILERTSSGVTLEIDGRRHVLYIVRDRNQYSVWHNGYTYHFSRAGKTHLSDSGPSAASGDITALMPGKVLRVEVAEGDTVAEKQTVAIMESMKMETALHAPKAGRVTDIRCRPGQVVEMGEVLITIE